MRPVRSSTTRSPRKFFGLTAVGALIVSAFTLALVQFASSPEAAPSVPASNLGVYRGAADPAAVGRYEQWLGRPVGWALDFVPADTWSTIESPTWLLRRWAHTRYRLVLSVPLLPATGGSLEEGAAGSYNDHFRRLAGAIRRTGPKDIVVRPGWEFNGDWYAWAAGSNPSAFRAYWRQVVTTMRSVIPHLRFDWCIALGEAGGAPDQAWPGNAYVDYVGADVYDEAQPENGESFADPSARWSRLANEPYGLKWLTGFASAHGKRLAVAEWGLIDRGDGASSGDDSHFVTQMHRWIRTHHVVYANYFQFDRPDASSRLLAARWPAATGAFVRLFGAGRG